ncbi:MAG: transporter substrate-binding domain-containing protein [Desulfuromonadales bacterium]
MRISRITALPVGFSLLLCTVFFSMVDLGAAQKTRNLPSGSAFFASERLALIKRRGTLIVGVKTDYPPFGMLNHLGESEGFEHDLAADIAKRLGVKLSKVSVTGSNRLQKVQEGTIDMVLATTGDTAERRQIATMIEPNYYASGVTLLMPPQENAKDWADIRGKKVCATQGSYFNRTMQQRYLLDLQMYNTARDAKLAVKNGRCIGYLFDNTAVLNDLTKPEWKGYKAPLPPALVTPWAIAISIKERGSDFEKVLGDIVADWHRSGFLIEREKAWNIPPSKFLVDSYELWQKKDSAGKPFCQRGVDGAWNAECRNKIFLVSSDVSGLTQMGLWLNERTGINLTLIYDSFDRMQYLKGLATTLLLTVMCIICSLAFGIVGAVCAEARIMLLAPLAKAGCAVARMNPPLTSMYVLLFGVGSIYGISLPALAVVVWCLSVYTGGGVMAAFLEAAATFRLQHPEYQLRLSNVRQLAWLASGSVTASLINVSKATMMASAFAVPELLSVTTSIINERGNVGVMMNALLLTYLLIIFCVVRLLRNLENRVLEAAQTEN